MIALAKFFNWREGLAVIHLDTFIRWRRTAFRKFWTWKSRRRGRPSLPKNLRLLIRTMAQENPT